MDMSRVLENRWWQWHTGKASNTKRFAFFSCSRRSRKKPAVYSYHKTRPSSHSCSDHSVVPILNPLGGS